MELAPVVGSNQNTDDQEMDSLKLDFGGKPLHILSAGTVEPLSGLTPGDSAYAHAVWVAVHDRLAALSTHGSNTIVPGSGHYIQLEKPEAVIETVRAAIEEVRKSKK
jgi:pimeloyl-ACP methyl ester carboxylesterase